MRIKDLKAHIAILFFIIVCFVAVNIVYDIGLNSVLESKDAKESEDNATRTASLFDIRLTGFENQFKYQTSGIFEDVTEYLADDYGESFSILNTIIAFSSDIEKDIEPKNSVPYVYCKETFDGKIKVGRIPIAQALIAIKNLNTDPLFVVDKNAKLVYTNGTYETDQFYNIIRLENTESSISELKENIANFDTSFSVKITMNEEKGYLAGYRYRGLIIIDFFPSVTTGSNLTALRLAYFSGLIILLLLLIIVVIRMVRKALGGSGLSSNSSRKTTNIVLIVKGSGKIIKHNKTFRTLFEGNVIPVRYITSFASPDEKDIKLEIKRQGLFTVYYENADGSRIYMEFLSVKHNNDYTLVGKDITKTYLEQEELLRVSSKSNVTGDENSFMLSRKYRDIKEVYKVHKTPYCIIMFNLRGFKEVNNLLGFNSGNEVLKLFSQKLHELYPSHDVYHLGADEFVVLALDADENVLMMAADKLINDLKAPIKISSNEIFLRPAIALISSDMDAKFDNTYSDLLEKIKLAIDRAKNIIGRSIVKYDDTIENAVNKQRIMEKDLKNAIINKEFVMYYQPQYNLNTDKVCGFEALIRWNNPKYMGTSPQVYIEMAEKNGYITDIGRFVNSDVFKTAKEMEQYGVHISINVSPAQIVQAGFVSELISEFEKSQLPHGSIAIEITETFLMENFQVVIEKLKYLKNRGFSIHLDDFGTGYSSMLYLKELPIDTIKIDREFIKHIETDKFSKVLTSKIISLAKELGDKVICEGVENKIQKDLLEKYGADIIQGYYIGKPLSKEDAFSLLKTGRVSSENKTS